MSVGVKKINDFALAMLEQASLDDLLWSIAQGVGDIMEFEDCVIYLRAEQVLIQVSAFGIKNPKDRQIYERIEIPMGQGIVGTVAETKVAEIVPDTMLDSRYIFDQYSGRSELTVPVIYEGETIAVIDSESKFINNYTKSEQELLQIVANIIAPRIASSIYQRNLQTTQIRLKRANSELQASIADLKLNQQTLIQSEKMASVGMLSAGIAHEINNPLAYSLSNLAILEDYITDIKSAHQAIIENPNIAEQHKLPLRDKSYCHVVNDLSGLTQSTIQGLTVAKGIVSDLNRFARSKDEELCNVDINEGIRTTLNIVNSQIKSHCKVNLNLTDLPLVQGNIGKLNQVFMNIILNASQACKKEGNIDIETYADNQGVFINISDNGIGIPSENLSHIFLPFFTTKPAGQGTGLGLSISYKIIEEEHRGRLTVASDETGTTFTIFLPNVSKQLACY
ncbi:ATP-binding protein [Thalassotalea nanhaiensis]|uniref:histidine kinase n=1 Tax=Thalassotalea nanhaiensis TaxID=3065648 RepID=A0ABY9TMZ4_9GAMM|nr:ATP-binding protein [Colwelliaceae bacterium SQ345]